MDFGAAHQAIIARFLSGPDPNLIYHDFGHTLDVFGFARQLAEAEGLQEHERVLVETAALLHDAGMPGHYDDHESYSARLAGEMLPSFGYSPTETEIIMELILNTRLPQNPSTLMGMILCDADLNYLGRSDFFIQSFKLKLEWQSIGCRTYSMHPWMLLQTSFLQTHRFFTKGAIRLREEGKQLNTRMVAQLTEQI